MGPFRNSQANFWLGHAATSFPLVSQTFPCYTYLVHSLYLFAGPSNLARLDEAFSRRLQPGSFVIWRDGYVNFRLNLMLDGRGVKFRYVEDLGVLKPGWFMGRVGLVGFEDDAHLVDFVKDLLVVCDVAVRFRTGIGDFRALGMLVAMADRVEVMGKFCSICERPGAKIEDESGRVYCGVCWKGGRL
jgi:hypothetical protein